MEGVIFWLSTLENDGGFAAALEVPNRRCWSVVPWRCGGECVRGEEHRF